MVKVEETGTTYTNGTYEIEKEANHPHIACFLSHHSYSFERSGNEYANPSPLKSIPTTRSRLSEAVTSMPTPPH